MTRQSGLCLHFMLCPDWEPCILGFLISCFLDEITIFSLLHMSFLTAQETLQKHIFLNTLNSYIA